MSGASDMGGGAYVTPDGRPITEGMIGRWCEAYERGEFPEGERSVGGVVMGRFAVVPRATLKQTSPRRCWFWWTFRDCGLW